MTNETIRIILPIVAVIVGGLLTFLGGYFAEQRALKRGLQKLRRERLEKAYSYLLEISSWVGFQQSLIFGETNGSGENPQLPKDPIPQALFNLYVYAPSDFKLINVLETAYKEFNEVILGTQISLLKHEQLDVSRFTEARDRLMQVANEALSQIRRNLSGRIAA